MSNDKWLRSRRNTLKCMSYGGAGTLFVLRAACSRRSIWRWPANPAQEAGPAPLKVAANQVPRMLGVTSVSVVKHPRSLALSDTTIA